MSSSQQSNRPLRIGYLVQQFPPEIGAGPARVTEMALRWQELGAHVTVVTAMPARAVPGRAFGEGDPAYARRVVAVENWNGLRVLRSWSFRAAKTGVMQTIANNLSFMTTAFAHAMARMGRVDVLIASSPPLFPHIAGAGLAGIRDIPLVLEIRDLWPDYMVDMGVIARNGLIARALFALERTLIRRAAHVTVVTNSFRARVVAKGADPNAVDVLPNGVDTTRYRAQQGGLHFPGVDRSRGDFLVGYLGTFGRGQCLTAVVDAARIVAARDKDVRILLVGDGLERERIQAHAADVGALNLSILPPIPKEQTVAFYNSCDVCLVPLAPVPVFQETVPSKMFEIMACERPVLASLEGEGRRIVEASAGGISVRPGDPEAIAQGILQLKNTPAHTRAAMGKAGREFVAQHYDRRAIADRYFELLQRVARHD